MASEGWSWQSIRTPIESWHERGCQASTSPNRTMRWLFSFLLLALLGVVQALSSSGSRLLVILEEESERENYSVLLEDLSSMYTCSFLNHRTT